MKLRMDFGKGRRTEVWKSWAKQLALLVSATTDQHLLKNYRVLNARYWHMTSTKAILEMIL